MLARNCVKRVASTSSKRIARLVDQRLWSSFLSLSRRSECRRDYTTESRSSNQPESLFTQKESPWDDVFKDIPENPPLMHTRANSTPDGPTRRHTMTAREINAFDEMFDSIFNAVSENKDKVPLQKLLLPTAGIGYTPRADMKDLVVRLRSHSRHTKWTSEADQELDRKKERIELCDTDQQLLDWALREVFGESQQYEEAARRALEDPTSLKDDNAGVELQPRTYPHMLALLIQTFREKYSDPHLALAVFEHARHLSVVSYVFGCTTRAYNELIETRWRSFRDIRGVCEALEEMRVNGIDMNTRTRDLAETIRRQVGERNLWQEENTIGSGEVWEMVSRIERLSAREESLYRSSSKPTDDNGGGRKWKPDQERWQHKAFKSNDNWEFGQWKEPRERPSYRH